jgi:hypothetical protein
VAVSTQPTGQTCSVVNGSGTVTGTVTGISISCSTNTYSVGGPISGLTGSGLVLTDNGGDALSVPSGASFSSFATPLAYGSSYSVAVGTQPTGQTCSVSNGSGTVTGTVTSASVSCTTNTFSIGGSVSGLTASGLVLTDNGGNPLALSSGSSSFTFSSQLAYGASYAVAVSTQPTSQTCSISTGSGTVTGTVSGVSVSCTTNTYNIGGSVSGLSQAGLVLTDNGGNPLAVSSGSSSFTFSSQIAYGNSYAVAVGTQPTGQTCTVGSASGTVTATVSSVTVSCTTNTYSIGGSISGLSHSGLVLTDNGGNATGVISGATSFTFSNQIAYGSAYAVAVSVQPTGQTCTVSSGSGTVTGTVSSVSVSCTTNTYSIGGSISGLAQNGLVLTDNGGNFLSLASGTTSFSFTIPLSYGSSYVVAVGTQPTGQTCTVSNASGTVTGVVTSVLVSCTTNTYSIGGSISGLSQAGLVLTDNGGNPLAVSSGSSSFTFSNQLSYGASYAVAVSTQPTGQTCSVGSASGTVTGTVSAVSVTCITNTYNIGGSISGLSHNGLVLTDNGGNPLSVSSGSSSFTFSTQLSYGAAYAVAVSTQPTGQTCTVSSGSGTVTATVTSVSIGCTTNTYTLGGTISGLTVSTLVLANGSSTATVSPGSSSWVFSTSFQYGSSYSVTVQTQPTGLSCSVTSGATGTLTANVSNVAVVCTAEWTWISGSSGNNQYGTYGTQGVAAAGNIPGAREYPATWIDSSGNLWLFGGYGNVSSNNVYFNDLWEYSQSTGEWTWVSGSSSTNVTGVYGTKGTPASGNLPGARYGSASWIDKSGNFWLFGGSGYGASGSAGNLNDLWEFSPSSGEWTWVSGGTTTGVYGVYGTQGVGASSNMPGTRDFAAGWIDSSNNLWIFGGFGNAASTGGYLGDLWKFSPSTGYWTFVSGSSTAANTGNTGVYGTQGVPAASNVPGIRQGASSWIDSNGNLWLFGGFYGGGVHEYNDLWEYSPSTGYWTWMSGSSNVNNNGVYGTEGTASSSNMPGSRNLATSWIDSSGNLWLFGGEGYGSSGGTGLQALNDLWSYSPSSGEWTWQSGSSSTGASGVYGTKGVGATTNVPGARQSAGGWIDSSNNLWLFGGGNNGASTNWNDLWRYQ